MTLEELLQEVEAIEARLADAPFVAVHTFVRDDRPLEVSLTDRLRQRAKRSRTWKNRAFLSALKNGAYGFDDRRARSRGGADGIFLLDRSFSPANAMMRKLFDGYLDRPESGMDEVARALGALPEELLPVRLVSHHLRLLGVLHRGPVEDRLVLVDIDDTK